MGDKHSVIIIYSAIGASNCENLCTKENVSILNLCAKKFLFTGIEFSLNSGFMKILLTPEKPLHRKLVPTIFSQSRTCVLFKEIM